MGETRELKLQDLRGMVSTVITNGMVMPQYAECLSEMRDWNSRQGFVNVEYRQFYGTFVEAGRDSVLAHAINENYDFVMMIDADAAPFPPESMAHFLKLLYIQLPHVDMVGGYCQQKNYPHWPTIDTGTGTWELHYPNSGVMQVIRTGCHFFMLKMDKIRHVPPPWFRSRIPMEPARSMAEFDNFCRIQFDGENPFRTSEEWHTLMAEARDDAGRRLLGEGPGDIVGEDSGFCDKFRAIGGQIVVDTGIVAGHVSSKIIAPTDLKDAMKKRERDNAMTVGVLL